MKHQTKVLLCDDDHLIHFVIQTLLDERYSFTGVKTPEAALENLNRAHFDLVIMDINFANLPSPNQAGIQATQKIRKTHPNTPVLMLSGRSDLAIIRKAMQAGAIDYVEKSEDPETIGIAIERILRESQLRRRSRAAAIQSSHDEKQLIGSSVVVQKLLKTIQKLRRSDANILITGESGTGKELVARMLRRQNASGEQLPFVSIDSSTIQSTMAESILFGHEKGAFTGADQARPGIFEAAHDGTVYFDEISNMPLEIQRKLLRVLQEKEVTRLGSHRTLPLEFQVICATNRNLEEMVQAGEFLADLYQRLGVIPIEVPPLREREDDLWELFDFFNQKLLHPIQFSTEAKTTLEQYHWPGNIRELQNLVTFLSTLCDSKTISIADLPQRFVSKSQTVPAIESAGFYEQVGNFESRLLRERYATHGKNISKMAQALQMDRSHLYKKLKQYGIHGNQVTRS